MPRDTLHYITHIQEYSSFPGLLLFKCVGLQKLFAFPTNLKNISLGRSDKCCSHSTSATHLLCFSLVSLLYLLPNLHYNYSNFSTQWILLGGAIWQQQQFKEVFPSMVLFLYNTQQLPKSLSHLAWRMGKIIIVCSSQSGGHQLGKQ